MRSIVLRFCSALAIGAMAVGGVARAAEQAVSAELIRLHDDLRLSAAQEGAWRAYAIAIAPDSQAQARHKATTELLPQIPTPRRIALIEATMAQDMLDFRRQGAAVNAFYATLTPAQKQTFDQDTLSSPSAPSADRRPGD
jgi:LTXXQ motif family protein